MGSSPPPRAVAIVLPPRTLVAIGVAVLAFWLVLHLAPVLLVIVVALFVAGTLNPLVERLERRGLRRGLAIAVVFTAVVLGIGALLALTVPSLVDQVTTLVGQEPALRARIADRLARAPLTAPLAESLRAFRWDALAKSSADVALAYSTRALEVLAYGASALFLGLYVMIDRDRLRGGLFALVPRDHHVRLARVLLNLESIVGGYIRGQVITSALMTAFVFALLMIVRVPNAIALAVFAGLADVLPYIGVFLSVGPAVIATLAKGPAPAIAVLLAMLAYEELESRVLVPRIYGRALRLTSSVVLVSLLAGGALMGIVGALLALPFAAGIRMLIAELRVELPGEQLDDEVLRERDARAEEEYEARAEGKPAQDAAAIAVAISDARRHQEGDPADTADTPITAGRDD